MFLIRCPGPSLELFGGRYYCGLIRTSTCILMLRRFHPGDFIRFPSRELSWLDMACLPFFRFRMSCCVHCVWSLVARAQIRHEGISALDVAGSSASCLKPSLVLRCLSPTAWTIDCCLLTERKEKKTSFGVLSLVGCRHCVLSEFDKRRFRAPTIPKKPYLSCFRICWFVCLFLVVERFPSQNNRKTK